MSLFSRLAALLLIAFALSPVALGRDGDDEVEPPRRTITNSVGMKFVLIRKGTFDMGSAKDAKHARDDEKPRHEVEITKDFYLGVYEVTQKQYTQVMGSNPSLFRKGGAQGDQVKGIEDRTLDDFPVENVSWDNAQTFIGKLNDLAAEKKARREYRLPTEAEWEYACRAGRKTAYNHGDGITAKQANYGKTLGRTCKVGSYKPNAWGLYDMHGNVWEWVADYAESTYYARSPRRDPKGPDATGGSRVHRGGSWETPADECRSAYRSWSTPSVHDGRFGFRVALVPPG